MDGACQDGLHFNCPSWGFSNMRYWSARQCEAELPKNTTSSNSTHQHTIIVVNYRPYIFKCSSTTYLALNYWHISHIGIPMSVTALLSVMVILLYCSTTQNNTTILLWHCHYNTILLSSWIISTKSWSMQGFLHGSCTQQHVILKHWTLVNNHYLHLTATPLILWSTQTNTHTSH